MPEKWDSQGLKYAAKDEEKAEQEDSEKATSLSRSEEPYNAGPLDQSVPRVTWFPPEMMFEIARRLGLLGLLSFRGVCRDWRSASSGASAEIESAPFSAPWFLLQREGSACTIYDGMDRSYSIELPELVGARCLASNLGWMLIVRGDVIVFFCPFSRSLIILPQFPHSELRNCIGVFTVPPTSPDCVVAVIGERSRRHRELHVLYRGAKMWVRYEYNGGFDLGDWETSITMATYENGNFYFLDPFQVALVFSIAEGSWKLYSILDTRPCQKNEKLPFHIRTSFFRESRLAQLDLGENMVIEITGTRIRGAGSDILINNEMLWIKVQGDCSYLRGIWIQPRFHQIRDYNW